jgi:FMN-dependent NADH-azoreductase
MHMKTLVVSYLPRGERSHTGKLLEAFVEAAGKAEIEHLDLLNETPPLLDAQRVMAYIRRNYLGETLSADDAASLAVLDRMTEQFVRADAVVLAFPMHNFSLPATVKAYFDGIMQKGKTWDAAEGGYVGLQKGKRALVLLASGGIYEGDYAPFEHALTLAKVELGFMGFGDIRTVTAAGMNLLPAEQVEAAVEKAREEARGVAAEWYG